VPYVTRISEFYAVYQPRKLKPRQCPSAQITSNPTIKSIEK